MDQHDRIFGNPGYVAKRIAAEVGGPAAIPRRNGEPVFNEPWESRVFGAAVLLCERGVFAWDEFRECLIAEISSADARGEPSTYYERFLAALERVLVDRGTCALEEIEQHIGRDSADNDHHSE